MAKSSKVDIVLKAQDHASREVRKVKGEMSNMGPAGAEGAAGADKLTASLKAMATAAAAAMSVAALVSIAKDSIGKFTEQEAAVSKLNVAVANNASMSAGAADRMVEYAASLQEVTTFGDEATIAAMNYLVSLGLTEEQTKKTIVAAQDYAAATGKDLLQATMDVGKAAQGELGPMKDYGLTLEEGATKGENLANILDQVNSKFGGQAAAQAGTYGGKIKSLEGIFGDLQEQLGGVIIKGLGPLLKQLPNIVKAAQPLIKAVGKVADIAGRLLAPALEILEPWLELIGTSIETLLDVIDPLIDLVVEIFGEFKNLTKALKLATSALQLFSDAARGATASLENLLGVTKEQARLLNVFISPLGSVLGLLRDEDEIAEDVTEATRQQTEAIAELGEAEKALADEKRARLEEEKRIIAANKELLEVYDRLRRGKSPEKTTAEEGFGQGLEILIAAEQQAAADKMASKVQSLTDAQLKRWLEGAKAAQAKALEDLKEWAAAEEDAAKRGYTLGIGEKAAAAHAAEKYKEQGRWLKSIIEEIKKREELERKAAEEQARAEEQAARAEEQAARERERHMKQITAELEKQNEEIRKQQEQYALLDDLAQKQVKWLLEQARAGNMTAEEFARLPDEAKRLIGQIPALREEYGGLMQDIGAAAGIGGRIERPPGPHEPVPLQVDFGEVKFQNKITVDNSRSVAEQFGQQALGALTKMSDEIARAVYAKLREAIDSGELAGALERRLAT